ncbi:MAG: tetratricopeptide repeat protein [Longimicrobiales bacterium]
MRAIAIDETFPPARNNLGMLYLHRGDHLRAAREFEHAAALGFTDLKAAQYAGLLRSAAASAAGVRPTDAARLYAVALTLDAANHRALDGLARLHYRGGRLAEAAVLSDSSIALVGGQPSWLREYGMTRALIALEAGDVATAGRLLERISRGIAGAGLDLLRALVRWEQGRTDEARAAYADALRKDPRLTNPDHARSRFGLSDDAVARLERIRAR